MVWSINFRNHNSCYCTLSSLPIICLFSIQQSGQFHFWINSAVKLEISAMRMTSRTTIHRIPFRYASEIVIIQRNLSFSAENRSVFKHSSDNAYAWWILNCFIYVVRCFFGKIYGNLHIIAYHRVGL